MIKIEEQKGHNWYVFLIIGLLIGAVLGFYASEKNLLKQKAVGKSLTTLQFSCSGGLRWSQDKDKWITDNWEGSCTSGGAGETCGVEMSSCTNNGGRISYFLS